MFEKEGTPRMMSELGFEIHELPIRVNEKILLHLGAGIYPSVAGVIKELVNNAFDADARQVVISTGYPTFDEIQVVDTGHGMSLERFKMALISIGNSMKDTIDQRRVTKKYRRPIIGRFGIGLIGLSQICDQVMIQSQLPDAKSKFLALIDFTSLRQNRLEGTGLSVLSSRDGGIELLRRQLEEHGLKPERREELKLRLKLALKANEVRQEQGFEVENDHLGHCFFVAELPALPLTEGTAITLLGIRPEVKRLLKDESRPPLSLAENNKEEFDWLDGWDWSWRELCDKMRLETNGLTYQALPSYHQFLYELALMSPVPYLDDGPISTRPEVLAQKKKQLKRFNFSVSVDNRTLYKPILLPSGATLGHEDDDKDAPAEDYLIRSIRFNDLIDGSRLRYHGYLYWQKKPNKPSTIRGIQLYICNVGIGLYDETLLNFSKACPDEGRIHAFQGQLSGEIYVEEGLQQALKVDRDSFRETDAHYVALQEHIWRELSSILQKSTESDKQQKRVNAAAERKQHLAILEKLIYTASHSKLNLTLATNGGTQPVEVNNNQLLFDLESDKWAGTKSERLLGQKVLLTMKAAAAAGASTQDTLALVEGLLLK